MLRKAIMRRSYLEKKHFNKRTDPTKSRKIIGVDFIKKKEIGFSMG